MTRSEFPLDSSPITISPRRPGRVLIPVMCAAGLAGSVGAISAGHHQGGAVAAVAMVVVLLGWASAQRTLWTVGEEWISHRGLFGSTTLDVGSMQTVLVPANEIRQGDLLFLGRGLRAVAVPAEHLRANHLVAQSVAQLLERARTAGVTVSAEATDLVARTTATPATGVRSSVGTGLVRAA